MESLVEKLLHGSVHDIMQIKSLEVSLSILCTVFFGQADKQAGRQAGGQAGSHECLQYFEKTWGLFLE